MKTSEWPRRFLCALPVLFATAEATTIRLDSTKTYLKTGQLKAAPGDTVCIEPGRRLNQYIQGIRGTAEKPIVVTNCPGGQVLIGTTFRYGLFLDSVTHVHITGSGDQAYRYGIHVDGTAAGSGLSVTGLSEHVEIDHLEISGTSFAGIMIKQDYSGSPPSPLPLFPGLSIHHNFIHHTGGEGMYLGETKSPGMLFSEVEVHHNLVTHTGWDLIQTANMNGVRVHHNVMIDGGTLGVLYQGNGYQVGDNVTNLRFDHNIVIASNANSAILLGGGKTSLDSNWFESPHGGQSLFIDNRTMADTGKAIEVRDNFWQNPTGLVWKNYDEVNPVVFSGNRIGKADTLITYASGAGTTTTTFVNNLVGSIAPLVFADSAAGDWRLAAGSPWSDLDLGFGTASSLTEIRQGPSKGTATGFPARPFRASGLPIPFAEPRGRAR
jgi:Right handed beta helix region